MIIFTAIFYNSRRYACFDEHMFDIHTQSIHPCQMESIIISTRLALQIQNCLHAWQEQRNQINLCISILYVSNNATHCMRLLLCLLWLVPFCMFTFIYSNGLHLSCEIYIRYQKHDEMHYTSCQIRFKQTYILFRFSSHHLPVCFVNTDLTNCSRFKKMGLSAAFGEWKRVSYMWRHVKLVSYGMSILHAASNQLLWDIWTTWYRMKQ